MGKLGTDDGYPQRATGSTSPLGPLMGLRGGAGPSAQPRGSYQVCAGRPPLGGKVGWKGNQLEV